MRRLLILWFFLLPGLVSAAGYEIRSGEHNGFSRLVIYLDRPQGWELEATDKGYALTLPESGQGFDISGVFEFIPKRRLIGISSAPGRLTLDVACDCPVQAFSYRPDILVLDIHSDQPDPEAVPNAEIVMPYVAPPAETPVALEAPGAGSGEDEADPVRVPVVLTAWEDRVVAAPRALRVLGFTPPAAATDERFDHAELVAGIAQAASHGLVTLSDPETRGDARAFPAIPGLRGAGSQVVVRDSLIRATAPGGLPIQSSQCLPAEFFAVADWGDPEVPASVVLSDMRAEGAPGLSRTPDADGVTAMIRSYLYLGFGSEAGELVRTYRLPRRDARIYEALSEIVDNPGRADRNPLADQLWCDGPAALWAFVATRNIPAVGGSVDADAILQSFQRLPWWLRVQIGETAAANFEARGDAVSAETIRASVARARAAQAAGDPSATGAPDRARDAQHALSDRAQRMRSAQSVLHRQDGEAVLSSADRAEITALVLETRGSEESVALLASYVEFASAPEDIRAAEQVLTVLSRSRFSNRYPLRSAWSQLLSAAVAQQSHDAFLGLLARNRRTYARTPPDRAVANAAIARLIATGLPESAAEYVRVLDASPLPKQGLTDSRAMRSTAPEGSVSDPAVPATEATALMAAADSAPRQTVESAEGTGALRSLLSAGDASTEDTPVIDVRTTRTDRPQPVSPLEALLASEAAVEVLGRVLDPTPEARDASP